LGQLPLCYRRLILMIHYVRYVVGLEKTHYAWLALADSYNLFQSDCPGYWMDVVYALSNLPFPVILPSTEMLTTDGFLRTCIYSMDIVNLLKTTRLVQ
ncbi:hypothetical protein B0H10DRAFT_2065330, partial [Mycena sp. CBHHK59/15]